jgi:hypothetical protein
MGVFTRFVSLVKVNWIGSTRYWEAVFAAEVPFAAVTTVIS